jgi:hypothetical protein
MRTHQSFFVHRERDIELHAQPDELAIALVPLRRGPCRYLLVDKTSIELTMSSVALDNILCCKCAALRVGEEVGKLGGGVLGPDHVSVALASTEDEVKPALRRGEVDAVPKPRKMESAAMKPLGEVGQSRASSVTSHIPYLGVSRTPRGVERIQRPENLGDLRLRMISRWPRKTRGQYVPP